MSMLILRVMHAHLVTRMRHGPCDDHMLQSLFQSYDNAVDSCLPAATRYAYNKWDHTRKGETAQ